MPKMKTEKFETSKNILKFADSYEGVPVMVSDEGIALVDNQKIVYEGSFLDKDGKVVAPGAEVTGVCLHRVIVTDGPAPAAKIIRGFIDTTKLKVQPDAATKEAIPLVKFLDESYQ